MLILDIFDNDGVLQVGNNSDMDDMIDLEYYLEVLECNLKFIFDVYDIDFDDFDVYELIDVQIIVF